MKFKVTLQILRGFRYLVVFCLFLRYLLTATDPQQGSFDTWFFHVIILQLRIEFVASYQYSRKHCSVYTQMGMPQMNLEISESMT